MDLKKQRRLRHKFQRITLSEIVRGRSDASLVANKYRVVAAMVQKYYPIELMHIEQKKFAEIADDIIAANREWQWLTEGKDKKNKRRLQTEFEQTRLAGRN